MLRQDNIIRPYPHPLPIPEPVPRPFPVHPPPHIIRPNPPIINPPLRPPVRPRPRPPHVIRPRPPCIVPFEPPVQPSIKPAIRIEDLTCLKGHKIQFFRSTDSQKVRRNDAGVLIPNLPDTITCNACQNDFSIQSRGGHYSCAQDCDFDLCVKCARCNEGH